MVTLRKSIIFLIIFPFLINATDPFISVYATPEYVGVVISTYVQTTDTLSKMIDDFNINHAEGFTVNLQENIWETKSQHDTYAIKLAAKDMSVDILQLDVTWPVEFAAAGWLEPVNDLFEETGYTTELYLDAHIWAGEYQDHQYSIPWYHDSAMLYYRADILEYAYDNGIIPRNSPPETWPELLNWTQDMLANDDLVAYFKGTDGILEGFVWQGREYEGLTCDLMEYLGGTGTYSFLNEDQTEAIFNSPPIKDTLNYMKSLVDTVNNTKFHAEGRIVSASPDAVLTAHEETSRAVWDARNAIFHRNWPYCYQLSMDNTFLNGNEGSYGHLPGAGKIFGVSPIPHQDGVAEYRTSCLGGWQLGLNTYSEHKEEAKIFMKWLTDVDQQRTYLLGSGNRPTRKALYTDPQVLASKQAYIAEMYDVFTSALPRPVHPCYEVMSETIWSPIHTYLDGGTTIDETVADLDELVNAIITDCPYKTTSSGTMTKTTEESTTSDSMVTTKDSTTKSTTSEGIPELSTGWSFSILVLTLSGIMIFKRKNRFV